MAGTIHHLALADEWTSAVSAHQPYRRSTIGRSLEDEGFIHCSFAHQVAATAERYYAGRSDVLVLEIDISRVEDILRVEDLAGTGEAFPHLYGPLPLDAVVSVTELGR